MKNKLSDIQRLRTCSATIGNNMHMCNTTPRIVISLVRTGAASQGLCGDMPTRLKCSKVAIWRESFNGSLRCVLACVRACGACHHV